MNEKQFKEFTKHIISIKHILDAIYWLISIICSCIAINIVDKSYKIQCTIFIILFITALHIVCQFNTKTEIKNLETKFKNES